MKISVVLGTRPEIIKMSPIIRYLENTQEIFLLSIPVSIIHMKWIKHFLIHSTYPPQNITLMSVQGVMQNRLARS